MSREAVDVTQAESDEEEPELECWGYAQDKIVGIQYYEGEVNNNEMVQLIREPDNAYDRYAIRVDNVRGVKVGHLPRVLVCHLSPLVDQGLLHLEGLVPRGANNVYKMPVQLYFFGIQQNRERVEGCLRRAGIRLIDPSQPADAAGSRARGRGDAGTSAAAAAEARPAPLSAQQMEDSLERMFDELLSATGPRPHLEADGEVLTQMFPHQKEALAWMCGRENSNALPPFWEPRVAKAGGPLTYVSQLTNFISPDRPAPLRGGVLADDMGLGKTLEVIALICTNRPGVGELAYFHPPADPDQASGSGAGGSQQAAAAAAGEQAAEAEEGRPKKRQRKGKEKVGEAPAAAGAAPATGGKGGKKLGALEQEAADRAAAAEGAPTLPAADGPCGTLIVCPLSVMSNWESQLQEHTQGNLSVLVYHGPDRDKRVASLRQHDVVITSYNILAQEAGLKNGVCQVDWLRVVLDEAHTIRNPKTQMAKAAHALKADRRWAVTGTPIQNSLQDLHGICRFLRLEPLDTKEFFTRAIERPIKNRDPVGLRRLQVLMSSIAMRRTKDMQVNGRPLVTLPPKTVHHVKVELDQASRDKYERWQAAGRSIIEHHLRENTLLQNYTAVLEILLRLRQICCHADLAPGEDPSFLAQQQQPSQLTPEVVAQLVELLRAGMDDECPVCLTDMDCPCITLCKASRCSHIFCKRCITLVINRDKPQCPLCRSAITERDLVEIPPEEAAEDGSTSQDASPSRAGGAPEGAGSAKVAALLERLRQDAAETATAAAAAGTRGAPVKSVVFSQFTSYLDIVERALRAEGLAVGRLDGKTSAKRRAEVLRAFAGAGGPTVLLVSLKAGGVGLNLVSASRVHLLDPWWNPAAEEQAMDRVHRLGQTRPVHIFRYTVADSVEERMLELQERKRDLMKVAFDRRKAAEVRAERIDDVRRLMEL